jgi:uncharacterized membrane protein YqjE
MTEDETPETSETSEPRHPRLDPEAKAALLAWTEGDQEREAEETRQFYRYARTALASAIFLLIVCPLLILWNILRADEQPVWLTVPGLVLNALSLAVGVWILRRNLDNRRRYRKANESIARSRANLRETLDRI